MDRETVKASHGRTPSSVSAFDAELLVAQTSAVAGDLKFDLR